MTNRPRPKRIGTINALEFENGDLIIGTQDGPMRLEYETGYRLVINKKLHGPAYSSADLASDS